MANGMIQTSLIDFYDMEIEAVMCEGMPYANLRRLCECLGLGYASQFQKLMAAHWAVVTKIVTTGRDGKAYEMAFVSADTIPMWVGTINANKVSVEIRKRIERIQDEMKEVLYQHFCEDVGAISIRGASLSDLGNAIGAAIGPYLGGVNNKIDTLTESQQKGFATLNEKHERLEARIERIESRQRPSKKSCETHCGTIHMFYDDKCPCCRSQLILNENGFSLSVLNYDHWESIRKGGVDKTWPVCRKCNIRLENRDYRRECQPHFDSYQTMRRKYEEHRDGPELPGF